MWTVLSQLREPWFHALPLVLVAGAAVQCLVAIWAARSSRHWFVRALVVWGAILLLVPLRAYEPVWLFAASSPLIVAMLALHERQQRKRAAARLDVDNRPPAESLRFAIADLLLLLLFVGIALAGFLPVARRYQPESWPSWLLMAVSVAGIAALTDMIVAERRGRWTRVIILLLLVGMTGAGLYVVGGWMSNFGYFGAYLAPGRNLASTLTLALAGLELAVVIGAVAALARTSASPHASGRWRVVARIALVAALVALAVPLGFVYARLARQTPLVPKFVAPNNPYDRIVAIAHRVEAINPFNVAAVNAGPTAMPAATTAELTQLYAELLPLLAAPSAVNYNPESDAQLTYGVNHLQTMRALARCLDAEAEVARLSGNHDLAAEYALATTRLGAMLRRGGVAVDALVGIAIESVGHHTLNRLRADLSPAKAAAVQAALAKIEAEREPHAALYAREDAYNDRAFGWRFRLESLVEEWRGFDWREQFERAVQREDATRQLLQTDLAIRLYQHHRDAVPKSLDDLVPDFLPAVPLDPYSAQPLKYRASGASFVLYSVGYDGSDDGGTFVNRNTYYNGLPAGTPGYDFDLDTLTRP